MNAKSIVSLIFAAHSVYLLCIVMIILSTATDPDEPYNETLHVKVLWEPHPAFGYMETICIMWFTVEYLLRFAVSPTKCKFVCGLMNLVDLIAIVPFFLELGLSLCGIDIGRLGDHKDRA